jgi:hypothetical protein
MSTGCLLTSCFALKKEILTDNERDPGRSPNRQKVRRLNTTNNFEILHTHAAFIAESERTGPPVRGRPRPFSTRAAGPLYTNGFLSKTRIDAGSRGKSPSPTTELRLLSAVRVSIRVKPRLGDAAARRAGGPGGGPAAPARARRPGAGGLAAPLAAAAAAGAVPRLTGRLNIPETPAGLGARLRRSS